MRRTLRLCALVLLTGPCNPVWADKQSDAAEALDLAESWLVEMARRGFAGPANQMWGLIQLAKQEGVQQLPVRMAYINDDAIGMSASADYGSSRHLWHGGELIRKTPVSLSSYLQHSSNGNSFLMMQVAFGHATRAFGLEQRYFSAVLLHEAKARTAKLKLRYPGLGILRDVFFVEQERVYRFDEDKKPRVLWRDLPFKVEEAGCHMYLEGKNLKNRLRR